MQRTKQPPARAESSAEGSRRRPHRGVKAIIHRRRFARPVAPVPSVLPLLALIQVGLAPVLLAVAVLALVVVCLLPLALAGALLVVLALVSAPLAFTSRTWHGWSWPWLSWPRWLLGLWSWLDQSWFRWPWLCWEWLHPSAGRRYVT